MRNGRRTSSIFESAVATCALALAQTPQPGRLDFLKSKDPSFALFANTSATTQAGKHYPDELVLITGLPSNPTISARIDLLGAPKPAGQSLSCGGLRNVVLSPDGDTALVSSDPSCINNQNTSVPADHRGKWDILDVPIIGTDPRLTLQTRRGTGYYKVPSLRGLWYRGPSEHNGSVATLEDWFDERRLRDEYLPTGFVGYGVKTRAVLGHECGLKLSAEDKKALIAFLRTL